VEVNVCGVILCTIYTWRYWRNPLKFWVIIAVLRSVFDPRASWIRSRRATQSIAALGLIVIKSKTVPSASQFIDIIINCWSFLCIFVTRWNKFYSDLTKNQAEVSAYIWCDLWERGMPCAWWGPGLHIKHYSNNCMQHNM